MTYRPIFGCLLAGALLQGLVVSAAPPPQRDFMIDVRQVQEQVAGSYHAGATGDTPALAPQSVAARNGEKATLRLNVSMPMQWVQKVESTAVTTTGATQPAVQGMTQALTWMEAGQTLIVTPRWSGGKQPVTLEVDLQTAAVDERTGAELPNQYRRQTVTTVSAPLGEWVTLATEGQERPSGSYSSNAAKETPRSIQIRVR